MADSSPHNQAVFRTSGDHSVTGMLQNSPYTNFKPLICNVLQSCQIFGHTAVRSSPKTEFGSSGQLRVEAHGGIPSRLRPESRAVPEFSRAVLFRNSRIPAIPGSSATGRVCGIAFHDDYSQVIHNARDVSSHPDPDPLGNPSPHRIFPGNPGCSAAPGSRPAAGRIARSTRPFG